MQLDKYNWIGTVFNYDLNSLQYLHAQTDLLYVYFVQKLI